MFRSTRSWRRTLTSLLAASMVSSPLRPGLLSGFTLKYFLFIKYWHEIQDTFSAASNKRSWQRSTVMLPWVWSPPSGMGWTSWRRSSWPASLIGLVALSLSRRAKTSFNPSYCQDPGVLILSPFAGAGGLMQEALRVGKNFFIIKLWTIIINHLGEPLWGWECCRYIEQSSRDATGNEKIF